MEEIQRRRRKPRKRGVPGVQHCAWLMAGVQGYSRRQD
jgi:hypothetical protein